MSQPDKDEAIPNRRGGLIGFGIVLVLIALVCLGLAALTLLAMVMIRHAPQVTTSRAQLLVGAAWYVGIAVWAGWLGIGSILVRRWARALVVASSWLCLVWGVTGLLFWWVYAPPMFRFMVDAGRLPHQLAHVTGVAAAAILAVFLVVVPIVFLLFYSRPTVVATCAARDPKPRWTDPIPMPVLVMIVILATSLVSTVMMAGYNFAYPFFGIVLDGLPGAVLALACAVLQGLAIWTLARMRPAGWWLTVLFVAAWIVSGAVTFARIDVAAYYERMGFAAQEVVLTAYVIDERGPALLGLSLAVIAAFAGYLIFIKRYFNKVERNS